MNEGSTSEFWFAYYLKQNGMKPDDVTVSNMSADDAAAAFMAGSIPAAVTWEPNLTLAKKSGKGKNHPEVSVAQARMDSAAAEKKGFKPLRVQALRRVMEGQTSMDEAKRKVIFTVG